MKTHDHEVAAAEYAGVSRYTLRKRRRLGLPPRYIRCGSRIIYRKPDVDEWLNAGVVEPIEGEATERTEVQT